MKTILVTGGAGFLGSNLCKALLGGNNKVICLDNFYTGQRANIADLVKDQNFTLLEHDIVEPLPESLQADEIYNLACPASPPHYQKDPVYTMKISVLGILNILELARKTKAKVLQASTSEIYGDPEMHPQSESYRGNVNPIGIRACYDEGKRCAETLAFDYHRQYGVKIKVIRIFNTYGSNMDPKDGRVVSNFIMQALENKDITVYGEGKQTRSLCYVDDLIAGMMKMMASDDDFLGPINLGNPEEYTVLGIAEKIIGLTNSRGKIVYKPLPQDDPVQRKPDIVRAREKLGWEPKIDTEEGLVRTIAYFEKMRSGRAIGAAVH